MEWLKKAWKTIDAFLITIAILIPTILLGIFHVWIPFFMFLAIDIVILLSEVLSKVITGYTVSQTFRRWAQVNDKNTKRSYYIYASWIFLILYLIFHMIQGKV